MQKKSGVIIGFVIFVIAFALSIYVTSYMAKTTLDGDASSDLVLAEHLAKTGRLISKDWSYSTEICVIESNLVNTLLFHFTDNWRLVRTLSGILHQLILVASFFFLCRKAKVTLSTTLAIGGLILLPASSAYGRIVLYHNYYTAYIILSFLSIGLMLGILNAESRKRKIVDIVFLFIVSFLSCLNGMRQIVVTFAPVFLLFFLRMIVLDLKEKHSILSVSNKYILIPVLSLFGCAVGFLGNIFLSKMYRVTPVQSGTQWEIGSLEHWSSILVSYLKIFGFRPNVPVLSPIGLVSGIGIVLGIWCFWKSVMAILAGIEKDNPTKLLMEGFFAASNALMIFIFTFTANVSYSYFYVLHFLPTLVWMFPQIACYIDEVKARGLRFDTKSIFTVVCVASLFISGLANLFWFSDDIYFYQGYEGLSYFNSSLVSDLKGAIAYLEDIGVTEGYATHWNCNVLPEITNGKIRTLPVYVQKTGPVFSDWLTTGVLPETSNHKAFLLLEPSEDICAFGKKPDYADEHFVIYIFDSQELHDMVFQ